MRRPLYKTFGSIELNPALKAAGWLAGYRRVGVCFCAVHFGRRIRGQQRHLLPATRSQNQKPSPDRAVALSSQRTPPAKGLCAANDSNRHARPTCCSPAGPRLSPSWSGPSRFLSLLLDFSSRQRQQAGLRGGGQVSACCLLDRSNADQAQTMRTGLNTRPSVARKTTLPTDYAGGIIQGQGHVLIGRRCPPPAESTIGPGFANM